MPRRMITGGVVTLLLYAATGCIDGVGPEPDDRLWQLDLYATSYDASSGYGTSCRLVQVLEEEPTPVVPPWASSVTMQAERQAGAASAPVSHIETVTLDVALDSVGSEGVRLVVSGPYSVMLEGEPILSGGYTGAWTCDGSFLFADDQGLLDAGLDPSEAIQGTWRFGPLPLPD